MGGPKIFRRSCTIRRFGLQEDVPGGYTTAPFQDVVTDLNVQPLSAKELLALPEGERSVRRVKAFGDLPLTAANQDRGVLGDWLFYCGSWYKCVSALPWDHTILAHCRSEFVLVPESELPFNVELPDDPPMEPSDDSPKEDK